MLINVKCPQCRDAIPVNESTAEQKIDCPGCGENFAVPGSGKTNPAPDSKSKSKDRDDRGRKSTSRRNRHDDDDDDDDRPHRRKEESGSGMVGLMVFGGIGLIVLAVGFGVTAWLIFSKKSEPEVAENPARAEKSGNTPNNNPFPNNDPPVQNGKNQPGLPVRPIDDDPPIKPKNNNPPKNEDPVDPPKFEPRPRPKKPDEEKPAPPDAPPPAPAAPAIMLPAPADQVVVGAGGKFLFLHIKSSRQVAVFDPVEKKIVKYVPVSDDDVLLAAGLEHLLLGYPRLKKIERVALATLEVDKAMDVPSKWPLRAIAIGANATNPLLAATGDFPFGDEFFLIDVVKMKRFDNSVIKNPGVHPDAGMRMWASNEGRSFTATSGGLSKPNSYQMRTTGWVVNESPCNPPLIAPDGELVFGVGNIATVSGQAFGEKRGDRGKGVWYLPAAQGPYFLSLNERTFGQWPHEKKFPELQVHIGRDQRPLITMPELPELAEFVDFFFQKTKPLDQHIFFFPNSSSLAILPVARDRIHMRTVDLKSELAKTTIDYLVVTGRPPSVKYGETFKYKPEVLSRKGSVKLRLDAGPTGMKLDGDTLVWTVPTRANQPPANVILSVSDASGQELFHSFEVTVFVK